MSETQREKYREWSRRWRENNPERYRELSRNRQRRRRERDPEGVREYQRRKRQEYRERVLENLHELIVEAAPRFWKFVDRRGPSECWLWKGSYADKKGTQQAYGRFKLCGKMLIASRVAYQLAYGRIPDGMIICHRCDVSHCVNPSHLFAGTYADNYQDMAKKGRRGKRDSKLLTAEQFALIRADSRTQTAIAKDYGISASYVWLIKAGKRPAS